MKHFTKLITTGLAGLALNLLAPVSMAQASSPNLQGVVRGHCKYNGHPCIKVAKLGPDVANLEGQLSVQLSQTVTVPVTANYDQNLQQANSGAPDKTLFNSDILLINNAATSITIRQNPQLLIDLGKHSLHSVYVFFAPPPKQGSAPCNAHGGASITSYHKVGIDGDYVCYQYNGG